MKKYILILFFISIAFGMFSQSIEHQTKFLFASPSLSNPNVILRIDTLQVHFKLGDTSLFSVKNRNGQNLNFIQIGETVSSISGSDTTLYFNYNLNTNDTFIFKAPNSQQDTFIVDSTNFIILEDNISYKHWYLHLINTSISPAPNLVWVKFLGEKQLGWNYIQYKIFDYNESVAAICKNNQQLVYWNIDNIISPNYRQTCDFDSIKRSVGIELSSFNSLKLYPNPVLNKLYIDNEFNNAVQYKIFNTNGICILEGIYNEHIDVSKLKTGLYNVVLFTDNSQTTFRVMKFN